MELQRCYEVLGIQAPASPEAVHQAYKAQVKFFHPDRFTDDPGQRRLAEERLKEVNAAYEALQTYQARAPEEAPRPRAATAERSPDRSSEHAGAAESPRPTPADPGGTSLMAQLRAIGERVVSGIGNALQNLRPNYPSGRQPGDPRQVGGCRRSGMGPRRSGRRMGRGSGGRRR
ncbi:MAG: J domain-containing protein [Desulfobacteraceae bacterium]|nr:J domain-containing protein [Desulfobacteraceae bacterium]